MKRENLADYLAEVNADYERTMNKIIFDKHLDFNNKELITHGL